MPVQQSAGDKRPIAVGDYVKLEGQDTPGQVLSISGKNATAVGFGMLKTTVKLDRLRHTMAKPQTGASAGVRLMTEQERSRQLDFKQEIDVRECAWMKRCSRSPISLMTPYALMRSA